MLLYLLDSGYPTRETLDFIINYGKRLDCVIMDGTMGCNYYVYHMNFKQNRQLKAELDSAGVTDKNTKFIISHITHNHAGLHEEIEAEFADSGIIPAYDGMRIEI